MIPRGLSNLTHEGILWFIIINCAGVIRDFGILLYSFLNFLFTPRENHVINKQKGAHMVVCHFPHFAFCLSKSAFCQGLDQGRSNVSCCSYYIKCSHCSELVIVFKSHCATWSKGNIHHYKCTFILKGWRLILQSLSIESNSAIRFFPQSYSLLKG